MSDLTFSIEQVAEISQVSGCRQFICYLSSAKFLINATCHMLKVRSFTW